MSGQVNITSRRSRTSTLPDVKSASRGAGKSFYGNGLQDRTDPDKVAQFWAKVDRTGDCWVWTGGVTRDGYGQLHLGYRADGRQVNGYAHRLSYEWANGPIPQGMVIRHSCDTPRCVNPDHLLIGTQADNIEDARKQGKYQWTAERRERAEARTA